MPGLTAQAAFNLQLEALNTRIPLAIEKTAKLSKVLGSGGGEAVRVSTHAFRIRLQTAIPSDFSFINLDTGSLPGGVGSQWDQFTVLPNPYVLPIQYSQLAQLTGEPDNVSSINPVSKTISDVVVAAARLRDFLLQTPGDGSMASVASTAGNVITLNSATTATIDGRGAHLLAQQQKVQIMSPGYVLRGSCRIQNVFNFRGGAQQIQVDQIPAGVVAGDLIIAQGLPAGAPQGINGIPVFINTSNAGNLLGLSRGLPYVQGNGVNAAQSQMSVPMLLLAEHQVVQRLGEDATDGLFWHWGLPQTQAYMELGWQLQYIPLDGGKAGGLDLMFKKDGMTVNGRRVYENIHADDTRADLINRKTWIMVKWGSTTPFWFKTRSGQNVFIQYDNTSGNPTVQELMYQTEAYQWAVDNPATQGGIFALKVPTGN